MNKIDTNCSLVNWTTRYIQKLGYFCVVISAYYCFCCEKDTQAIIAFHDRSLMSLPSAHPVTTVTIQTGPIQIDRHSPCGQYKGLFLSAEVWEFMFRRLCQVNLVQDCIITQLMILKTHDENQSRF